jgi:Flp pilus assembly pilin Flp
MISRLWKRLFGEEHGQDLIEYSLLMAFVALAVVGVYAATGDSAADVWDGANDTLSTATSTASGANGAAASTGGGDGHHHHHRDR